jgi:hypothetical protein
MFAFSRRNSLEGSNGNGPKMVKNREERLERKGREKEEKKKRKRREIRLYV